MSSKKSASVGSTSAGPNTGERLVSVLLGLWLFTMVVVGPVTLLFFSDEHRMLYIAVTYSLGIATISILLVVAFRSPNTQTDVPSECDQHPVLTEFISTAGSVPEMPGYLQLSAEWVLANPNDYPPLNLYLLQKLEGDGGFIRVSEKNRGRDYWQDVFVYFPKLPVQIRLYWSSGASDIFEGNGYDAIEEENGFVRLAIIV